jgi:hypothetical protein
MWVQRQDDKIMVPLRRRGGWTKQKFPSWSWTGWVGLVCYNSYAWPAYEIDPSSSGKTYKRLLRSNVKWPWNAGYGIAGKNDVFESGIMTIDVDFGILSGIQTADFWTSNNKPQFGLDGGIPLMAGASEQEQGTFPPLDCFLLAQIDVVDSFEVPKTSTSMLLAVEKGYDDVYYRIGCFPVSGARWAETLSEKRRIRLG